MKYVLRSVATTGAVAADAFARGGAAGFSADEVRSMAIAGLGAATAFFAAVFFSDFFEGALADLLVAFFAADFFAAFFAVFFTAFLAAFFDALRDFFTTRLLLAARFLAAAFLVTRAGEGLRAFLAF